MRVLPSWHPLQLLPPGTPRCVALVVLAGVAGALAMRAGDPRLHMVEFELARTGTTARSIITTWDAHCWHDLAVSCIRYDNWFLVAYSTGLALLVVMAAAALPAASLLARTGPSVAWAMWVAGACDRVENAGLMAMLAGATNGRWPAITFWFSVTKWTLIGVGAAYLIAAVLARFLQR